MTAPTLADLATPFFEGCGKGKLLLPKCDSCHRFFFYPTVLCPHCHSNKYTWTESAGLGTVYSYTVVYRPPAPALRERVPYGVVVVDLEEQVRIMAAFECDSEDPEAALKIGLPVEVGFGMSWDNRPIPVFHERRIAEISAT